MAGGDLSTMGNALATAAVQQAPTIISLVLGGVQALIHRQEGKTRVITKDSEHAGGFPADPVAIVTATPLAGEDKRAAALDEFKAIVLPFLGPALSALLKKPIDESSLMVVMGKLIDDGVELNNVLGIFPASKA